MPGPVLVEVSVVDGASVLVEMDRSEIPGSGLTLAAPDPGRTLALPGVAVTLAGAASGTGIQRQTPFASAHIRLGVKRCPRPAAERQKRSRK